jgi:hypothetical protein
MLWFLKNIFPQQICKKWRFAQNYYQYLQKFDHLIGLWVKRQFFSPNIGKITENDDITTSTLNSLKMITSAEERTLKTYLSIMYGGTF